MNPTDLNSLHHLMSALSQRYGNEPPQHLKPHSGAGKSKAVPSTQSSLGALAQAAADMMIAEQLARLNDNLERDFHAEHIRTGTVHLPTGPVSMTITHSRAKGRQVREH